MNVWCVCASGCGVCWDTLNAIFACDLPNLIWKTYIGILFLEGEADQHPVLSSEVATHFPPKKKKKKKGTVYSEKPANIIERLPEAAKTDRYKLG